MQEKLHENALFVFLTYIFCFSSWRPQWLLISLKWYLKYTGGKEIRNRPNGLLSHITRLVITLNCFSIVVRFRVQGASWQYKFWSTEEKKNIPVFSKVVKGKNMLKC